MTAFKKFCIAVGAILIVYAVPVTVLPLRFTFSGICGYLAMVLITIINAGIWCIPDEEFL